MATAEARFYHEQYGIRCVFGDKTRQKAFWEDEVFRHNPRLVREPNPGDPVVWIANYPGHRPYIKDHDAKRVQWNNHYHVEPGELYLTPEELQAGKAAKGYVLIEPHTKDNVFSRNKAWPWERWQAVVDCLNMPWLQIGPKGTRPLKGVTFRQTDTFREALGVLANAALLVTTDGALHHAAAALNVPAIVLWGGLISPEILGYGMAERAQQKDLWHGAEPCGAKHECEHCKRAMRSISVDEVAAAVLDFGLPTAMRQGRLAAGDGKAPVAVRG